MRFVDTHCHIHFADYGLDPEEVMDKAAEWGVDRLLAVGCTMPDSKGAVEFAACHDNVWAAIGLHPHEGAVYVHDHHALQQFHELAAKHSQNKIVAIGEIGLDYYYENSPKEDQKKLFRLQMDIAVEHSLPLIFHVREAFDDFWEIFDEYTSAGHQIRGVVHSFSSNIADLEQILKRGLYVGLNGIMTFTKNPSQLEAAKAVPLDKLLLETDAPFLTPVPFRGKIGEPKYVRTTGEFLANLREEKLEELAKATTANAQRLFNL